jgi:hypothetical protein
MRNGAYIMVVAVGSVAAILFFPHVEGLSRPFRIIDALGTAAYGVVGASKASQARLAIAACIFVGVVNAVGSGLIRDMLVREEPLLFKPAQFYVIASFLGVANSCWLLLTSTRRSCRRHLSDGGHVCLPSSGDLLRLEDQGCHAAAALQLIILAELGEAAIVSCSPRQKLLILYIV